MKKILRDKVILAELIILLAMLFTILYFSVSLNNNTYLISSSILFAATGALLAYISIKKR